MTNYEILEEFETTKDVVWQKRKYSSGKIVYRNSKDFRKNRKQQSYAGASKHKRDTSNKQIGEERKDEEIFIDEFQHRIIEPNKLWGDYFTKKQDWFISVPEFEIIDFKTMFDEVVGRLENKIQKQGEDEPSWDQYDIYHYYISYLVIRDGEIFDSSRRYTQSLDSLDEMQNNYFGVINELVDVATGYDNILVTEYGIQAKVIK